MEHGYSPNSDAEDTRNTEFGDGIDSSSLTSSHSCSQITSIHNQQPASQCATSNLATNMSDHFGQSNDENTAPISGIQEQLRNIPVSVIGHYRPFWIPDNEAPACMLCDAKFSMIKRRHHCRGCGKVHCAQCCSVRVPIPYLDYKEARVCNLCLPFLSENGDYPSHLSASTSVLRDEEHGRGLLNDLISSSHHSNHLISSSSNQNLTSLSSDLSQTAANSAASASCPVGVLKRNTSKQRSEPKQVIFFDGIRPGNDLQDDQISSLRQRHTKIIKSSSTSKLCFNERNQSSSSSMSESTSLSSPCSSSFPRDRSYRCVVKDSRIALPPIINSPLIQANPTCDNLMRVLADETLPPVTFCLGKNLLALVKLVKLDCCNDVECWTFTSQSLASVGQDEIIIVLERLREERTPPQDVFRLFTHVYDSAIRGVPFTELSHILYPEGIFESKENAGFLFIRPTFQCLSKIILPSPPFLFGILIMKCEIPWVKVFPLRLVLNLGAEYKCYPTPLMSYRTRKPAYFEIGHTIINILADFRNFQYSLPMITGLTIQTNQSTKETTVNFPLNLYEKVMKAISTSNEHVLSFGGNFHLEADSHLTCIQNDDGQYYTQTITIQPDVPPSITGASFIVFIGSLKPSTGLKAKISVVEDGLLVQMPANSLQDLKSTLKDMKDIHIECGKKDAEKPDEIVHLVWEKDDKQFNIGVRSCIDGISLEGVQSIRMYNGTDYESDRYLIRWIELFLIKNNHGRKEFGSESGYDVGRMAEIIAQSFCIALMPHLDNLMETRKAPSKIGLRVTLDIDKVGYDTGTDGEPLPASYINQLDAALIPTIMSNAAPSLDISLVMELIFYILIK